MNYRSVSHRPEIQTNHKITYITYTGTYLVIKLYTYEYYSLFHILFLYFNTLSKGKHKGEVLLALRMNNISFSNCKHNIFRLGNICFLIYIYV